MFPSVRQADALGGARGGPSSLQPVEPTMRGSLLHGIFFLCPHNTLGACFVQNLLSQLIYLLQFRKFSS